MDMITVSGALTALKETIGLVKVGIAAKDEHLVLTATLGMNDRVIDVQNAALSLQEQMSNMRDQIEGLKTERVALRGRIEELEQSKSKRERFKAHKLSRGVVLVDAAIDSEMFFCQPCMETKGNAIALQKQVHTVGGRSAFGCPECQSVTS